MIPVQVPKAIPADVAKTIFIPQPYGMFVLRRRLNLKGKIGVGTYGLATCISVLISDKDRGYLYVSHYDQEDTATAASILKGHLAYFRQFCKSSLFGLNVYIIGSTPASALGRRLEVEIQSSLAFYGIVINSLAADSFSYFPGSGNLRWVQDPSAGTHKEHFDECAGVADRITRLRLQAPQRAFRYEEA